MVVNEAVALNLGNDYFPDENGDVYRDGKQVVQRLIHTYIHTVIYPTLIKDFGRHWTMP